jgi:glycosyltransferase involved in cell wall biosynthesis
MDLTVVNSRRLKNELAARIGIPDGKILHAPLAPHATISPCSKNEARAHLGLPSSVPIACYTGKMPKDQADFLFEVAIAARTRISDFRMLLVGGNPRFLSWAKARVAGLGLQDTVMLPGFVEPATVGLYQAAADVLVFYMDKTMLHYDYCTPAKGFDYQAAGRPIVAGDLPLFDEVFGEDGERAIRVDSDTPEDFAEAIARALALDNAHQGMTARALSWVKHRTWEARVDAILDRLALLT